VLDNSKDWNSGFFHVADSQEEMSKMAYVRKKRNRMGDY
jgi:hypothetical protein